MHYRIKRRLNNFIFQEKYFREQQQELNTWHQGFWEKQNEKFSKVRSSYICTIEWQFQQTYTSTCVYYTGLQTQSPRSGSFIFKMVEMLQIPRVFHRVPCLGSARAVQCPRPGPNIGDKSQQIPCYSPLCPRDQPPGMAADKCVSLYINRQHERGVQEIP